MTTETFNFSLLFDAATERAQANINALNGRLDQLGNNAVQEAAKVRSSFAAMGKNAFSGMQGGLTNLGNGFKGLTSNAAQLAGGLSPVGGQLVALGGAAGTAALGVAAVGAAMVAGAMAAGRWADAIDDTANSLNVSNGFLQVTQAAITRAGGDADAFGKNLGKMNLKLGEAATGNASARAAFAALGVSITDASGKVKDNEVVFGEVRNAIGAVSDESQRAALANDIFGKGAKDMNGILRMSASEYAALTGEVAAYGVASDENIALAGKLGDGMDALGQSIKAGVINAFAPMAAAMGDFAISVAPMVGKAFAVIGEIMDVVGGVCSMLWDGLKALWNIFGDGIAMLARMASPFGALMGNMKATGGASRTLRDQFIDGLQSMLRGAGSITGSIAAFFARMSARIQNSVADIKNGIVRTGLGGLFGLSGQAMKVDVNAAGEAARGGAGGGFNAAANFVDRYRNRGGSAETDDRSGGNGGVTGGAGGGGSSASNAAADAAKKYEEQLAKLQQAQREVAYSEEQKAISDALTAAGLPPLIDATDAHSTAIRNEVLALRELEAEQRANKGAETLVQRTRDAALSQEDLAKVEARRAAGLSDNLAVTNQYIARLDAQAVATFNAAQATIRANANEKVVTDLAKAAREADWQIREQNGEAIQVAYESEIASIIESTEAMRKRIAESTTEGALREQQLAQLARISEAEKKAADDRKAAAQTQQTQDAVDNIADKLVSIWEGGKQAFRSFLKEVLLGFAKMAAANFLNGKGMTGGQGIGGMFKSVLGNVFGVSSGFGGFKASGGPVNGGQGHIVGENGREYFRPHTDGDIIPASALGGNTSTVTISMPLEYHAAPGGNGNDLHEAARVQRMIDGRITTALQRAGIRT